MKVRNSFRHFLAAAVCAGALACAPAVMASSQVNAPEAGSPSSVRDDPGSVLSAKDQQYVNSMAQAGNSEIALAKMATAKASDIAVKQFAEKIIADHGKARSDLEKLAAEKGVTLPTAPDPAKAPAMQSLVNQTGVAFDRAYMQQAAFGDQPEAQKLFQDASTNAEDPDVKAFAKEQVPVIARHLEMAKSVGHSAGNLAPSEDGSTPFREPRAGTER
jgi:putative membrane protein